MLFDYPAPLNRWPTKPRIRLSGPDSGGNTIATNASGSRTLNTAPDGDYVERLKMLERVIVIDLRLVHCESNDGAIYVPLSSGRHDDAKLHTYQMRRLKACFGYFVARNGRDRSLMAAKERWVVMVEGRSALAKPEGLPKWGCFSMVKKTCSACFGSARAIAANGAVARPSGRPDAKPTVRGVLLDARDSVL